MTNTQYNTIAWLTAPYTIELINHPMPTLEDEYALVEYLYCGICGGDYSAYCGYRQNYPISLGHEFVGRVLSIGKAVKNLAPHQIVVSDFNYRCNECTYCISKRSHLCKKNDVGYFSNRGFAKYASIHANYLIPIIPPDYLPRACLIEPLSCVIHAASYAKIHNGMRILLCGGGGIGMLFSFLLKRAFTNISLTLAEVEAEKADKLYKQFGVNRYSHNLITKYDLVIDCSNCVEGLMFSLNNVSHGGNICIMSHLYGHETSFVYELACKRELNCMFPLRNGERSNMLTASYLINSLWRKDDDILITTFDDINEAFKQKKTSHFCKHIVDSTELIT